MLRNYSGLEGRGKNHGRGGLAGQVRPHLSPGIDGGILINQNLLSDLALVCRTKVVGPNFHGEVSDGVVAVVALLLVPANDRVLATHLPLLEQPVLGLMFLATYEGCG